MNFGVRRHQRAFGLVVWFSLRVREVPSSILGMPHFFLLIFFLCWPALTCLATNAAHPSRYDKFQFQNKDYIRLTLRETTTRIGHKLYYYYHSQVNLLLLNRREELAKKKKGERSARLLCRSWILVTVRLCEKKPKENFILCGLIIPWYKLIWK